MSSPNCSPLNRCLACGSSDLKLTLDLGTQPPANSYKATRDEVQEEYPLAINRCLDCYHVQLTHVVNPDILYRDYPYVSGTSQTMKEHFKWFAEFAYELLSSSNESLFMGASVLDIGCNDGSQLNAFKELDNNIKTDGVDPAANLTKIAAQSGQHHITTGYFDQNYIDSRRNLSRLPYINRFDIIVAQNVFAHNPDPEGFLRRARQLMFEESLLFIQTSQADMILNGEFDTIYHEHISFYNINSMNELCKRSDVYLYDVVKCPLHGNSYIFVITRDPSRERKAHIANLIAMEKKAGLLSESTYKEFEAKSRKVAKDLKELIDQYTRLDVGWYAIGYGAAAKAMTLLNFSGARLDFIVDDNPLKQGKFTPGQGIPIVSSDELAKHKGECLLVPLAWNFFDEIKRKIEAVKPPNKYDKYVRYFPEVRTEART